MRSVLLLIVFVFLTEVSLAKTIYFSLGANPKRFIPFLAVDSSSAEISSYIFNGLLKLDKDMHIIGDLAKSYEIKDGGRKIVFHLRHNVFWQDGVPFEAKDVIFTYKLITNPNTPTPYAGKYKLIKNIYAPDKYTVVVEYPYPFKPALYSWMMGIVPEHLLKNAKNIATAGFNRKPLGTGPYILKDWKDGQYIKLDAFDKYFIHKPYIQNIVYRIIPDPTTALLELENGGLDMLSLTPLQYEYEFKGKPFAKRYKVYFEPSSAYTYLGFNLKDKFFRDVRIRKAICMAINREEIKKAILFGFGRVADSIYPQNSAYFYPKTVCRYDPEGALKLLKEAGWHKGRDGFLYKNGHRFSFTLYTNEGNNERKYAAIMIQEYLRRIGIEMKIRILEWQAFLNFVNERHFDAVILGWQLGADPDMYSIWHSKSDFKGGFNFVGFRDKKVDKLIELARRTFDKKVSQKIYKKINDLIVHQYPYIFLYYPTSIIAVNRNIKGIKPAKAGITYNIIDWRY